MSDDRHAALLALAVVLHACTDAVRNPDRSQDLGPADVDAALVRSDLISLLALLHHSTTKLSLALKPSSPTYSASLAPLSDTASHVIAISQCTRLFKPPNGLTLANEAASLVKEIIESVRSLAQTLLDIEVNRDRTNSGHAGDDYLVRTAAVHDLIDKADGLSVDNVTAVRKIWLSCQASLDDGYNELVRMTENGLNEEEEVEDGWDELGLVMETLSPTEVERTKKAQAILRMSTLLHKRVGRDLLSVSYRSELNPHLDLLPQCSSALLVASDDIIASMYGPQNTQDLATELTLFKNVIENLQSPVTALLQGKTKLWFATCFEQIFKAVDALSAMVDGE
ncbi:hypothetical protein AX15_003934 [Amanita polypyramis BW_CC]|nr:hypothetical protein AX15_003934 [Amanita polypyramis BW_CC]